MNYQDIINNPDYTEITSVEHEEIKPFVKNELAENQGWARAANMYQLLGILAFILGAFKAFMPFYVSRDYMYLVYLAAGIAFLFTIGIVLHELIHAIAYKIVGAKHVSFGMNIRKFLFYVQADGEVINYRQFKIIALAPAVVIGVLSVAGMAIFYNQALFYFFLAIFGLHSFCCGGDFGMLCFFQNRPDEEIVTFDMKKEGKTFFYKKSITTN
ncbi:DUF3267 domain-containing protein [Paludibacter sp. 221]|uniref:DUF3267 domain-containing protein n=1 Tax=Paludibacter sp. 221 TaxID=2302939 RepID=UPI0013D7AA09|nr:DUF3267 domain-containing protein [Paludibacter sp. 221]NDV46448.1 DUF3267 domain-containing protein [Paludibacter sp. 221]